MPGTFVSLHSVCALATMFPFLSTVDFVLLYVSISAFPSPTLCPLPFPAPFSLHHHPYTNQTFVTVFIHYPPKLSLNYSYFLPSFLRSMDYMSRSKSCARGRLVSLFLVYAVSRVSFFSWAVQCFFAVRLVGLLVSSCAGHTSSHCAGLSHVVSSVSLLM